MWNKVLSHPHNIRRNFISFGNIEPIASFPTLVQPLKRVRLLAPFVLFHPDNVLSPEVSDRPVNGLVPG